jgi:two-component system KDP operon response regulator KdpE
MSSHSQISGLLVEDVKAMRIYLRAMLENENVLIAEASSLAEARGFLRASPGSPPDFVVLDLELPDGNGLDLMPDLSGATRVAISLWRRMVSLHRCVKGSRIP